MEPTPTAASPDADFGSTTTIIAVANDRYQKLLRFKALKRSLAELRAEHDRLQGELFGIQGGGAA